MIAFPSTIAPYLEQYLQGTIQYARKTGEQEALLNLDAPQGANGGDSSMVLTYLRASHRAGGIDADFLMLNCGLHDIKTDPVRGTRQVPLDAYRRNLREIVALVRQMGPRLIWVRTTPCDEAIHNARQKGFHRFAADCGAYNAAADQIMAETSTPSIDLYTFTKRLGPDLYCDHVHFHDAIRRQQAAFLAGWLMGWSSHNQQASRGCHAGPQ